MAMPIKETPVLKGKDAKEFIAQMKSNSKNPISDEKYNRAKKTYEEMKKSEKFKILQF